MTTITRTITIADDGTVTDIATGDTTTLDALHEQIRAEWDAHFECKPVMDGGRVFNPVTGISEYPDGNIGTDVSQIQPDGSDACGDIYGGVGWC